MVAVIVAALSNSGGTRQHRSPGVRGQLATTPLPFSKDSVWNAPLPAAPPTSQNSSTYVSDLEAQVKQYGPWINTTEYSVPVYTVGRGQHRVPMTLDESGPGSVGELAAALRQGVPIPTNAKPAAGSDASLVIWQPSTNTMWEFWQARLADGTWHAHWGGRMSDVSENPGYFDDPRDWGASATSLPLLGGLITPEDLQAGSINHALAVAIPHAEAHRYVFPAQRSDGNDPSPMQIPEGTRFRLKPGVNVSALHLPRLAAMMAHAAQRYGMIVRDQSGVVSFYAQDPTSLGHDPWGGAHGAFDGVSPAVLLRSFPWQDLEALRPASDRTAP